MILFICSNSQLWHDSQHLYLLFFVLFFSKQARDWFHVKECTAVGILQMIFLLFLALYRCCSQLCRDSAQLTYYFGTTVSLFLFDAFCDASFSWNSYCSWSLCMRSRIFGWSIPSIRCWNHVQERGRHHYCCVAVLVMNQILSTCLVNTKGQGSK